MANPTIANDAVHCASALVAAATNGTPPFGRIFEVNNTSTWADAILPRPDGYLVMADYAVHEDFALNLSEFDAGGRPLRSRNLSVIPSLANTARMTADGGVLIGAYTDATPHREGLLIKLNDDLDVLWAKVLRSDGPSSVEGVAQTADGGIIALVTDNWRMGVVKLDVDAKVMWKKAILPLTGSSSHTGAAYDVYENTYLDAQGQKRCGGYVVYGVVERPGTDWDL